ncbi:MAG: hypothetical protein Q7J27_14305 [Syntrophales bacterium]|nr:hypothetical protein [Syntrophales bacterium]
MRKEFDWFDKPENIKKLKIFSYVILALSVVAEFFVSSHPQHSWDKIPGIYALFGFITCVTMIVVSKLLGQYWLKRDEKYYDK